MEYQEANYIITYFPRLMTTSERIANSHHLFSSKLGNPEDYKSIKHYEKRKDFFKKRNIITDDLEILKFLENGYGDFVLKTAKRIKRESPNQYKVNRCSKCNLIARTPYAKQCRKCEYNWHDEIEGEFKFEDTLKITSRSYLWIMGELVKGEVKAGNLIDLTNFQLNIIAEVKQIEFALKSIDGVRKDYLTLGIEVNLEDEELIKQYLTKSAKTIMILRQIS